MRFPPLALLLPGVKLPVASAPPACAAAALVPLTGATVAMLVNSEMVYWKGITGASRVIVMVVTPACAFGRTYTAEMVPEPELAVTAAEAGHTFPFVSPMLTVRLEDHA